MNYRSLLPSTRKIVAEISLPGSKSLSNRALLIASIAKGQSVIDNLPINADVLAGINALKSLGIEYIFNESKRRIIIQGANGSFPNQKAEVFCSESGTLTRFIIPLCAAQQSGEYYVYAAERMMMRPISEQLVALESLGMVAKYDIKQHKMPLKILAKGLKQRCDLSISGARSSQFLSGLLIAAPLINNGLKIFSHTDHFQPYVSMTVDIMRKFGIALIIDNQYYQINKKNYQGCCYTVEPDVSTASYFWALAAITQGKIKVKNISIDTKQGDIRFLEVLKRMGCNIIVESDGITVIGPKVIKGVSVNMRNFSDTFMIVAIIACFSRENTNITGIAHTRFQESDRLKAIEEGLIRLGVKVKVTMNSIHIYPRESKLKSATIDAYNDHRVAMSLALIGIRQAGVVINGIKCVNKTCPDYFERMDKIIQLTKN